MSLTLEIQKELTRPSERVKSLDVHPSQPWILASLHSGNIFIWNYQSQAMVNSLEVAQLPVRSAKFVTSQQWIVTGADDGQIRIYNYNTTHKVKEFEAHTDFIRCIVVHPTLPYLLSSSDDQLIKLWDWKKDWACTRVFKGHSHYAMQVAFDPKDTETFASASLDGSVKLWKLSSPTPSGTLKGHSKGVTCIEFFTDEGKPCLISGSDDYTAKVWDRETKICVKTLEGHTNNVTAVCVHPELPILITASEDETVRVWHATTYELVNTLSYGLRRAWAIGCIKDSHRVVLGYDEGTIVIKVKADL
ncbi:coatomer subunit beta'-2-like [Malania oleifera]|uniref:coatomer subunit beta'-2-like n=1 Tax=Malania oleifera TaxID=397392 RepID=UPI0025AEB0E6|nr:coatomer subunit beta'-2-like [Malania oleifera]